MTFYELPLEVQRKCALLSAGEIVHLGTVYVAQGKLEEGLALITEGKSQLEALMIWKRASGQ